MEQSSEHSSISGFCSTSSVNIASKVGGNARGILSGLDAYGGSSDVSLFSSSLPVLSHEKLNFTNLEKELWSTDDASLKLDKCSKDVMGKDSIGEVDLSGIGNLLPDDEEELLAGVADGFDLRGLPNQVEDVEDCDLFGSGGGMELDFDPTESLNDGIGKTSVGDGYTGNGSLQYNIPNGASAVAGEHPYGEHPSRTLFVRNINSNVEDSELRCIFEQYGDIRTLYTACKHRGFVMISYYDIRAARTAMRALQNKPVRRRKLDIHFSIPKENPSEKDMNQGTLVVFNLDPSVTNDDLRQIFGAYGEVKEIRETPHKRHHKFIEYYDVRSAEAALRALNRCDIAGKRIKLEPSRPGGARRNLIQQLNQDVDNEDCSSYRHQVGSPITNSPPGILGSWAQFNSPNDNSPLRGGLSQSPTFGTSYYSGLSSILPSLMLNSLKIKPIGKEQSNVSHNSHSFPDSSKMPNVSSMSGNLSSFGPLNSSTSPVGTLTGPEFLWGSPTTHSERSYSSAWSTSSVDHSTTSNGLMRGFPYSSHQGSLIGSAHHHVGSAPTGVPFERHSSYFPESAELSYINQVAFGSTCVGRNQGSLLMNMGSLGRPLNSGAALSGNVSEHGSPSFRMLSPRPGKLFLGSAHYPASGSVGIEGFFERSRTHRVDYGSQLDSKKQFELDLEKIVSGEDSRTTLMIKNIPNKYTSKMLLASIDENHRGTYDFFYLPIDFKNKCNVGYAFINMVSPAHVVPFYQDFNGKKWEKFNSEKVATLAYARIQGKSGLVAHFQNSSLMNDDKRCGPILFHSEGDEVVDQEFILSNGLNICVRRQDRSSAVKSEEQLRGEA